ncbi:Phosphoribosylformylglycinamidine cyclo-ligase [Helicobacter bizzozeronii CCUG 35545]|nr:Phosphoribosylformylglycinamidine cyclo-ligase [Helicobacter bizzozeronii CCUG 35545]
MGGLGLLECFSVFNMGIGMVIVLESGHASQALGILEQNGVSAYVIGEVVSGEGVELC